MDLPESVNILEIINKYKDCERKRTENKIGKKIFAFMMTIMFALVQHLNDFKKIIIIVVVLNVEHKGLIIITKHQKNKLYFPNSKNQSSFTV